jgi:hypothetical protein
MAPNERIMVNDELGKDMGASDSGILKVLQLFSPQGTKGSQENITVRIADFRAEI